ASYLEAAEQMVRRWPNSIVALGYRADARCHTAARIGAKADLRRAMELAPDYEFAGVRLFDLCMEDGEHEAARKALDVLRKHCPGDAASARGVQFGVHTGERDFALRCLTQLCTGPAREPGALDQAMAALRSMPTWLGGVETLLHDLVAAGNANPLVGTVWVEDLVRAGKWKEGLELVGELLPKGGVGINAAITYLHLASRGKQESQVRKCIKTHAAALRADDAAWGAAGRALRELQDDNGVVRWMADWRTRKGAAAWMLYDLAVSLRRLGRDVDAVPVIDAALALPPDGARRGLEGLSAFEQATAGPAPQAAARLARLNPSEMEADQRFLRHLTEALLHLAPVDVAPQQREEIVARAKAAIANAEAAQPAFRSQPDLYRSYCRTLSLLGRAGVSARFWSLWRRAGTRSPSPAARSGNR